MLKLLQKLFHLKGQLKYINGTEVLKPPLSSEEEQETLAHYAETNDLADRDRLIEHNLRLVIYVAKKFSSDTNNLEDLVSIGTLGLIKAINTFKPDKNIKLATYASRCIENEILMVLRKRARLKKEISLDEPLNKDSEGNELLLQDVIPNNEKSASEELEERETIRKLETAINNLKPREREILAVRFGLFGHEELTQKDTAKLLNISQSYISRLEKRIIKKLRVSLEA